MSSFADVDLFDWFDNIDIYLFDQILKGRFLKGTKLLDAGCGHGRNLVYFLRAGHEVFGVDRSPAAIEEVQALAKKHSPELSLDNFRVEDIEKMSFKDAAFDVVISSAVLHFSSDIKHFNSMVSEMWRVLRPGGMFFSRLASSIGIEDRIRPAGKGRYKVPDGSTRFLVDEVFLREVSKQLGGRFLEPIKTVNVEGQRCMTTWCLRKD